MTYIRAYSPAVEQMVLEQRPSDESLARYYFRLGYMAALEVEDK